MLKFRRRCLQSCLVSTTLMLFNKKTTDPDEEDQSSTQVLLILTESKWNNEGESCQTYNSKYILKVVENQLY